MTATGWLILLALAIGLLLACAGVAESRLARRDAARNHTRHVRHRKGHHR